MSINEEKNLLREVLFDGQIRRYVCFGKGNKTLIILPGLSLKSVLPMGDAISNQYSVFTDAYTVYLVEPPELIEDDFKVHNLSESINRFIETLDLKNVSLYGVSLGGMIALDLALSHPNNVEKIMLVSSTYSSTANSKEIMEKWCVMAQEKNMESLVEDFVDKVYTPAYKRNNLNMLFSYFSDLSDKQYHDFYVLAKAAIDFDIYDRISEIKTESFVMGSKKDGIFAYDVQLDMANKLHAKNYFFEEGAHSIYDEEPGFMTKAYELMEGIE